MSPKPKRVNLSKQELVEKMAHDTRIVRMTSLVKLMWPLVENQDSIYDAQTVFQALGGYLDLRLKEEEEKTTVGSLKVDLSKEKDSKIKSSMLQLLGLLEQEKAKDTVLLVRKVADHIGQFGASEFVKGPMSNLKVTDLVK